MADLQALINSIHEPSLPWGGKRIRLDEEEIRARLAHYEQVTDDLEVTEEHFEVMKAIFTDHRNVFITGGAGTGKTTLIKHVIIPEMDHRNLNWSVTATTGIAGSHISGKTMHSFFGLGKGLEWPEVTFDPDNPSYPKVVPNPQGLSQRGLDHWYATFYDEWMSDTSVKEAQRQGVINRIRGHEVILIDEISMCHGDGLLGFIDFMMKQIRGNDAPFGGCQMIFVGDFAQLPPVEQRRDIPHPDWAFMSRCWDKANVKSIELTKIFRQGDIEFINFLNSIRAGNQPDREFVSKFVRPDISFEESQRYAFLFPKNEDTDRQNAQALAHYPGPTQTLEAEFCIEDGLLKDYERNKIDRVHKDLLNALGIVRRTTFLRIGVPVMFTSNDPGGDFVNGTRGFVREINILPREGKPPFNDNDSIVVGVPDKDGEERLITVRRWAYSRSRHEDVKQTVTLWDKETAEEREVYRWPVIRHFPLIAATAITIHKSQGMSMDWAILDLSKAFAAGHVYVGLSRLRSPDGMVLLCEEFKVIADPYVLEFYRSLRNVP